MTDAIDAPEKGSAVSEEDLAALLEQERGKRREAERERDQARARANTAERERTESRGRLSAEMDARFKAQEDAVDGQIAAATSEADRLESEYADLMAEGKWKEAAKVQRELGSTSARLVNLKGSKEYLGNQRKMAEAQAERQPDADDPLKAYSPAAKDWIRKHPAFLSDDRYRARVIAYHNLAIADGLTVDTPEYFAYVEQQLGEGNSDKAPKTNGKAAVAEPEGEQPDEPGDDIPTRLPQRPASTVTPVTRKTTITPRTTISAGDWGPVRLSPDEVEAADISMPDVPGEDWTDAKGQKQAGRYRRFKWNQDRLRKAGRLQ